MWRQVNVNVFRMFPRRPTTTDTVESMMMRVMKPMKITTAISQRGNVNTHTAGKAFSTFLSYHPSVVTIQNV